MNSQNELIKLENISLVRDDKLILNDINLTINDGDFVAITGPNGGGKTSLLRIILGLLKPSAGTISFTGGKHPRFGYLPQKNSVDAHFPITVREVISSALLGFKELSKAEKESKINSALATIDMEQYAWQPIGKLSGGQLQRTLFARAIVAKPEVLVLDEPLSYLDNRFENRLYDIVSDLAKNTTIILVSHQMNRISQMANRQITIDRNIQIIKKLKNGGA